MASYYLLFLLPLYVACFSVTTYNDGFTVFVADLPLINHKFTDPCISVGSSKANFTEISGNFIITENITERIHLTNYTILSNNLPNLFSVQLSNVNYPSILVNLTITEGQSDYFSSLTHVEVHTVDYHRIWFGLQSDATEKIYGGGEQFTYLSLKGREYPLWTREQGVGRNRSSVLYEIVEMTKPGSAGDYHTTYYPIPLFLSSRNYAIQHQESSYSVFNFTNPIKNELYIHNSHLKLTIGTSPSLLELVSAISKTVSQVPPSLPEWIYNGAIISAEGGTQHMLETLNLCLKAGVNISALWIQDWAGKIQTTFGYRVFWNWRWNEELYPGLDQVIQDLAEQGIAVAAYINPHLNVDGDVFQEAEQLGYLLNDTNNQTLKQDFGEFYAATIDLTLPEAKQWYSELIQKNILDFGFSGFMADFGEYTPLDAVPAMRVGDEYEFHNMAPVYWAATVRSSLEQSERSNEILTWARAGFTGAQKYHSMVWNGDQNVDWSLSDGLPSSIVGALSLGLSGFGLSHSDIGGYTTIDLLVTRSQELLLRWAEYSAFTPVMRTHEGNKPSLNHQIYTTPETLSAFAKMTNVYTTLTPYHKEAVQQCSSLGLPSMRPLFLHYPNDLETFDIQYEYLYGRDLLVAPVIEPGIIIWNVYLPTDQWIHLWDLNSTIFYGPGWFPVEAPIGKPPVFYRKNTQWLDLFEKVKTL